MSMMCGVCGCQISALNWQGFQRCPDCTDYAPVAETPMADKMVFQQAYSDKSGIEFSVALDVTQTDAIRIFSNGDASAFPIEQLEWLIGCLERIRTEITE